MSVKSSPNEEGGGEERRRKRSPPLGLVYAGKEGKKRRLLRGRKVGEESTNVEMPPAMIV